MEDKGSLIIVIGVICILIVSMFMSNFNNVTKNLGGTTEIELQKNEKLINVTWKDDSIWVLTKNEDKTYYFKEYSDYGLLEGTVIIKEQN